MAYLKPNLFIFIKNNGMPISAMIEKVAFRKYWGKRKDKTTGQMVRARKSMPYAICKVMTSKDPEIAKNSLMERFSLSEIQALINKCFEFARSGKNFDGSSPSWEMHSNALSTLNIFPENYDDLDGFIRRAIQRREGNQ